MRHALGLLVLSTLCAQPLAALQQGYSSAPPIGRPIVLHEDGTWSLPGEQEARESRLTDSALTAIQEGRIAEARDLLGRVLVSRHLREAGDRMAAGEPADALTVIDRALEIEPDNLEALLLRARGLLALGDRMVADGAGGVFVDGAYNDALKAYRELGATATGRLGAARAAYMLNRSDEALGYAREASALIDKGQAVQGDHLGAERVIADAIYLAYADAANGAMTGDADASAREEALFPEAQGAVDELIATVPQDPGTWQLAANLLLFRAAARNDFQAQADAMVVLERGLERLPEDRGLLQRAIEVARGLDGGASNSVALLDRYLESNSDSTYARQLRGVERFELAMAEFPGRDEEASVYAASLERFRAAEGEFRHVRLTGGEGVMGTDEALSWEIICRNARGWVRYWEGDLAAARAAFLATEELHPRGLEWDYAGRLQSGILGLQYVVSAHVEAEELVEAAEIADVLHARLPEDPDLANNSGFLNRDAAMALANASERLCRAARGEIDDPAMLAAMAETIGATPPADGAAVDEELAAALAAASRDYASRARATMVASGEAYQQAARLSPDDVRVVNDTALVYVYYLHTDLDRAEEQLLESVRLGAEQIAAGGLNEQDLYELKNAWGDAHENLGVHFLAHRDDLDAAESWFLKAIEIGPDPRPIVDELWLAHISARRAGAPANPSLLDWVTDCE